MTPGVTPKLGQTPKTATHAAQKTRGMNTGDNFVQSQPFMIEEEGAEKEEFDKDPIDLEDVTPMIQKYNLPPIKLTQIIELFVEEHTQRLEHEKSVMPDKE